MSDLSTAPQPDTIPAVPPAVSQKETLLARVEAFASKMEQDVVETWEAFEKWVHSELCGGEAVPAPEAPVASNAALSDDVDPPAVSTAEPTPHAETVAALGTTD